MIPSSSPGEPAFPARPPPLHPLVRIAVFLALALVLPQLRIAASAGVLAALAMTALAAGSVRKLWQGVRALRWLLAALLLTYLAFTPGPPLLPALPGFSRDGAREGVQRALLLLDLVAAIAVLIGPLPAPALAAALRLLLRPLRPLLPVDGIVLRIALTLAAVGSLSQRLRELRTGGQPVAALAALCADIESGAARAGAAADSTAAPALPELGSPPLREWLFAAVLVGLLVRYGT
jgi:hypothetical protein